LRGLLLSKERGEREKRRKSKGEERRDEVKGGI